MDTMREKFLARDCSVALKTQLAFVPQVVDTLSRRLLANSAGGFYGPSRGLRASWRSSRASRQSASASHLLIIIIMIMIIIIMIIIIIVILWISILLLSLLLWLVYTYVCVSLSLSIYIYICMCICMCVYIYIYIYNMNYIISPNINLGRGNSFLLSIQTEARLPPSLKKQQRCLVRSTPS